MADGIIKRFVRVIFDRSSAQKAEQELVQGMGAAGKKSGDAFVRNLKTSFAKEMSSLKQQLAKGIIDEKEFKKRADAAAKTFNKGIIEGMEKARKAGTITDREFIKLGNTLKRTGDQGWLAGGRISSAFAKVGVTLSAAFAIQKGIQFFKQSIEAALEAERSIQRLDSALKPLGTSYKQVGKEAEVYLDRLQETTRFSDEDAREALTALVTGTGDYKRSLELLDVTAKIAEKRQISMADAASVALKLSQGLTKGMLDLGIGAGETGDLIKKVSDNLGDFAVAAGKTNEGVLKRAANLWDEFQENIGLAVLGSEAWKEGNPALIKTLVDLNKWVQENSKSIGEAADSVAQLVGWLAKLAVGVIRFGNDPIGFIGQQLKGRPSTADPLGRIVPVPGPTPPPGATPPPAGGSRGTPTARGGPKIDTQRDAERAERESASDREALAREIETRTLMLENQLKNVQPAIKQTETVMVEATDNMGSALDRLTGRTESFKDSWVSAFDILQQEVWDKRGLIDALAESWAEGNLKGIASYALSKVKENLAWVIENVALAIGSFALGNPKAAAEHAAAAAKHGAAAAAWKVVANTAGGGGGGGGAGGSVGSGTGRAAASTQPAESEINIYLTGPGWDAMNPAIQKVVRGAIDQARERYGENSKVRVQRAP